MSRSSEANRINQDIASDRGIFGVTRSNNAQSFFQSLRLVSPGESLPFSKVGDIRRRNFADCSIMSHINIYRAELHSARKDLKVSTEFVFCVGLKVLEMLGDSVAAIAVRSLKIPTFDKVNMRFSRWVIQDAILQVVLSVIGTCCVADLGRIDGRWKPRSQKSSLERRIQHSIACSESHAGR